MNVTDSKVPEIILDYFGAEPTPLSFDDWVLWIEAMITGDRKRCLSGHHNLHSLYLQQHDATVARFYGRCDNCYIDGAPVRLILAGTGISTKRNQRFSLMDMFPALLQKAQQNNWRIFYLGSESAVVGSARHRIKRDYPDLKIMIRDGYFESNQEVLDEINSFRPHLLLVGMGMPLQESWLIDNLEHLDIKVATHAGATLDYFGGYQASPPLWAGKLGVAWLYRLLNDPIRLWHRYLIEPWALIHPTAKLWLDLRFNKRPRP